MRDISFLASSLNLKPNILPALLFVLYSGKSRSRYPCSIGIRLFLSLTVSRITKSKLAAPYLFHAFCRCLLGCVPFLSLYVCCRHLPEISTADPIYLCLLRVFTMA